MPRLNPQQTPSSVPQIQKPSSAPQRQTPSSAPQIQKPSSAPQRQKPSSVPWKPKRETTGQKRPSSVPWKRPSSALQKRPSSAPWRTKLEKIPVLGLDFSGMENEEPDEDYAHCIVTIYEDSKGSIYGNFCEFVDDFPYKQPDKLGHAHKLCLMYDYMFTGGYKRAYYLEDSKGKKFVATDEIILDKDNLEGFETPEKYLEYSLHKIKNEITIQQNIYMAHKNLVPRIYSVNFYVQRNCKHEHVLICQLVDQIDYIINKSSSFDKVIIDTNNKIKQIVRGDELTYRIQILMEKVGDFFPIDYRNFKTREILKCDGEPINGILWEFLSEYVMDTYKSGYNFITKYFNITLLNNPNPLYFKKTFGLFYCLKNDHYIKIVLPEYIPLLKALFKELKKIHAMGYIHGDLKFENVAFKGFLDNPKDIKIIDFGLTRKLDEIKEKFIHVCSNFRTYNFYTFLYNNSGANNVLEELKNIIDNLLCEIERPKHIVEYEFCTYIDDITIVDQFFSGVLLGVYFDIYMKYIGSYTYAISGLALEYGYNPDKFTDEYWVDVKNMFIEYYSCVLVRRRYYKELIEIYDSA